MPAVTFTVATKTFSTTITGPNATRFGAWAAAMYPTIPNPAYPSPDPVTGEPTAPPTIPNPEPAISALEALFRGLKTNVLNWEREQSKKTVPEPADLT